MQMNEMQQVVQEVLTALTRAGIIRWDKFQQTRLEELTRLLQGKEPTDEEHPCYAVDLRLTLGYMEDIYVQPAIPGELAEPVVAGHSLQLSIGMLDEEGQVPEPEFVMPIGIDLAAEAEISYKDYEEVIGQIQKIYASQPHGEDRGATETGA
jgi:hypothetical protein